MVACSGAPAAAGRADHAAATLRSPGNIRPTPHSAPPQQDRHRRPRHVVIRHDQPCTPCHCQDRPLQFGELPIAPEHDLIGATPPLVQNCTLRKKSRLAGHAGPFREFCTLRTTASRDGFRLADYRSGRISEACQNRLLNGCSPAVGAAADAALHLGLFIDWWQDSPQYPHKWRSGEMTRALSAKKAN